ncbi:MAG: alpha/beta fold hydrolase [Pseudomonadota bacterium]
MLTKISKATAGLLLLVAAVYTGLVGFLYVGQESLIFVGEPLPEAHQFEFEVPYQEVTIDVDGAALHGLHFRQPDPRGLVFFLHGNGGNLESWTTGVDYYRRVNYDMFMLDYRGYGKSTGEIDSEAQLHADVRQAWNTIAAQYPDKPIVLYGRSLGAALAVQLATDVDPDLLILVSPFESMLTMAQARYPFVPAAAVRYPFRNDLAITKVSAPIVLVHGDYDTFIPLRHSQRLQELAVAPTKLLVIQGAEHNDIHEFRSYTDGLTDALPN